MQDVIYYLCVVLGVFVSLVLPVIRKLATPAPEGSKVTLASRILTIAEPYLYMAILSLLVALVIVMGLHANSTPIVSDSGAFMLGYFSDATIQKLNPKG